MYTYINNKKQEVVLLDGQKVCCTSYGETPWMKGYKRPFIQRLLDRPFSPVKFGIIIGSAGVHNSPHFQGPEPQEYLFVRFLEYKYDKAIPIRCIQDVDEFAKEARGVMERSKQYSGKPGFEAKYKNEIMGYAVRAEEYGKD